MILLFDKIIYLKLNPALENLQRALGYDNIILLLQHGTLSGTQQHKRILHPNYLQTLDNIGNTHKHIQENRGRCHQQQHFDVFSIYGTWEALDGCKIPVQVVRLSSSIADIC